MYALESLNVKSEQLKQINSWWNSVYRKIFGFNKWDSVKELICLLGRLDLLHMVNVRRLSFIKRIVMSDNVVMSVLMYNYYLHGPELKNVQDLYNIKLNWSSAKIKDAATTAFKNMFA